MKLQIIERKHYTVAVYVNVDAQGVVSIPAFEELRALGRKYAGSAEGFKSLFKVYSEHGRMHPYGVTMEQMHHANYDPDIYEFRKGDVRLFCIRDGKMVILTNAGIKHGDAAHPPDVNKAKKIAEIYFADKDKGNIQLEERKQK